VPKQKADLMAQPYALMSQPVQADKQPPNNPAFDQFRESIGVQKLNEGMKAIVGELQAEVNRRIGLRQAIEQRWIEDLEQYHNRYDQETEKILIAEERSRVFINMTRPKTNAMGARFKDLLFPTDDKNWGIVPTPVPRLTEAAERAANEARELAQQAVGAHQAANDNQDAGQRQEAIAITKQARGAKEAWAKLNAAIEEARRRSNLMAEVIDDQLTECNYQAIKRDQIDWAMKIGTGVTKGPVTGDRMRRGWKQKPVVEPDGRPQLDANGKPVMSDYALDMAEGDQPGYRLVDPWGFFPDMDVAKIEDANGVFERHLKSPKKLRDLQKLSGFDVDALRRLLESKPITSAPAYISQLRNIRGEAQDITGPVYHVWEYNGPLEPEQMRILALATDNRAAFDEVAEADPLMQVNACVWFCDNEVLKFALYPYDSGECMYSVFNLVKDESCVFGYGMPALLRDLQAVINGAWRGMMDNAGISSGPQIVIDKQSIEPADGDYVIRPRKIWYATKGITKDNLPFQVFNITNNQAELANIIVLAERFIDIVSTMPQIAQGEQGNMPKDTPYGSTVLMMNSANVVFRDGIKNWDDDVTVPDIRRLYDWNMQFSKKEEIKGDYDIKAMGSSVLLVREIQATSLMTIALQFGGHPIYGPMLKNRDLLRKIFQAHMIPADEIMLTDEQIDAVLAAAAKQAEEEAKNAAQADKSVQMAEIKLQSERERIEADVELANMKSDFEMRMAKYARDTAMMQLAAQGNMKLEEIKAMLEKVDKDNKTKLTTTAMTINSNERMTAVEAAVTQAQPPEQATGGGHF
jgi:hypothetical protein